MVFTKEEQIKTVKNGYRHVVILGAGASKASCIDNPEKNNKGLPLMNDLPKVIDLKEELSDLPDSLKNENFETIFSELFIKEGNSERLKSIEEKLYTYFENLELPDSPTIYDNLVLSLRDKDVIATFNWDPFLWQAYVRSMKVTKNLPNLLFLHGNVAIGVCEESKTFGPNGYLSLKSEKPFLPTKLLYPVGQKNYTSDTFIESQWKALSNVLETTARLTIFGYSAPVSDLEAINMMKKAWGDPKTDKQFTQVEIIDIQTEEQILKSWDSFIHSHHYEATDNFFKSSIMRFPRRTGEVFHSNYLEGMFYEENYPPKFKSLEKLYEWYKNLISNEKR
jgi:hypothetical protein